MTSRKSAAPARHKWMVLSNTTLGMLAAAINSSILLISLPAVFRGIGLKALDPGNINYLLWAIIGYMVATAVLVVSFGRLGDQFGRARMYNLGFALFTAASIALSLLPGRGDAAALYLIGVRIVQGVGGALMMANATALLTDAFPEHERGFALGINVVAIIAGQFLGLIVGGLLADGNWRLVFWINVPVGLIGTAWSYWQLHDAPDRASHKIDWGGNLTFGIGLVAILAGITYGLQPYGDQLMAWSSPKVLTLFVIGVLSRRLRLDRAARGAADAGPAPVHARTLRLWQSRQSSRRHRPRRPAIHAHHLAARHLAAAARLCLRGDAALVGHLHAAADGGLSARAA